MRNKLIILLSLLWPLASEAQDNLGIAGSTRAPVNTVLVNPSTIVDSRAFIDINLAGFSVFARNNLVYIPGKGFTFKGAKNITGPSFRDGNTSYQAFVDVGVHGPSATFAVKQHAFGIYTGFRTVADVRGIPKEATDYINHGFVYPAYFGKQQTVKDLRAAALSWLEAGITYGTIISRSGDMITQGAITAKRLYGVAGLGVRVDNWTYTVQDSTHMQTSALRGEYAFNDPGMQNPSILNGKGWGFDLGITFKQRKSESSEYVPHNPCTDGDYNYRFGFSLLDIGAIKFNGPFYRNKFSQDESTQWQDFNNVSADEVSDIDSLMTQGLGVSKKTADQSKFVMMLPGAFSAQVDYNLGHGLYCYGVITTGFPWKNRLGVQRASYLGVAPRWEKRRFEVAVPVSLYEFRYPQVGMMMRFNSIIIGSDNLGWFFFKQNIYGADIYLSLKITIFRHPGCRDKKEKKAPVRRRNAFDPVPCPTW